MELTRFSVDDLSRDRPYFGRDEKGQYLPSPELKISDIHDAPKALDYKRRKLKKNMSIYSTFWTLRFLKYSDDPLI